MSKIERFEDLLVWQRARENDKSIFLATVKSNQFSKDFALTDQMRRSSGSIMDNIAEGFERSGNKEFIQFLSYSKSSSGELKSQLYRAFDRKYIDKETFDLLYNNTDEISKMISGFTKYLKKSDFKGDKFK